MTLVAACVTPCTSYATLEISAPGIVVVEEVGRQGQQPAEHGAPQIEHDVVRGPRKGVVGDEAEDAARREQHDDEHRVEPDGIGISAAETAVQQRLHDGGKHRLRCGGERHAHEGDGECDPVRAHVAEQAHVDCAAGNLNWSHGGRSAKKRGLSLIRPLCGAGRHGAAVSG
jgi:hypothetical protein